jgi:hypothetical protein
MHTKAHTCMIQICRQKSTYKYASKGSAVDKRVGYGVGGPRVLDRVKNFFPYRVPGIKQPESKAGHSTPYNAKFKGACICVLLHITVWNAQGRLLYAYIHTDLHTHKNTLHTYIKYGHNLYLHIYSTGIKYSSLVL